MKATTTRVMINGGELKQTRYCKCKFPRIGEQTVLGMHKIELGDEWTCGDCKVTYVVVSGGGDVRTGETFADRWDEKK